MVTKYSQLIHSNKHSEKYDIFLENASNLKKNIKKVCDLCGIFVLPGNFARHKRKCTKKDIEPELISVLETVGIEKNDIVAVRKRSIQTSFSMLDNTDGSRKILLFFQL